MSTELQNESKTVAIVKEERTWRIELFTERNTEYKIVIHRELSESQDGVELPVDRKNLEIPKLEINITDILASAESVNYNDVDNNAQTFDIKNFPNLVAAYCDKVIADKKAE